MKNNNELDEEKINKLRHLYGRWFDSLIRDINDPHLVGNHIIASLGAIILDIFENGNRKFSEKEIDSFLNILKIYLMDVIKINDLDKLEDKVQ